MARPIPSTAPASIALPVPQLATVVRGLVDRRALAAALQLEPTQRITLAPTVGHPLPQ